ncbi:YceI family protein [Metallibacterium scheffleri]|jgi:polyisoprenoid-binding protein YceI|uniref:YceI family protein n=1 Tax=Metallibacterium scheffleri TaxID=993689 RepID=UPI0026EB07D7|nr:YceI family protein [Metallibacterium scheffleri]MBW8074562.1 polyisoprenoid-binding protein [Metallibacterium scheffleri]
MTANSRRRARRLIGAAAALGLAAAAHAAPVYSHVQPGAQVDFQATQMGVPMKGHFGSVSAQVHFAPQDLKASRVEFSVATASVDAGSGQTDELLRGPDWLDAKADPQARFVSSAFQPDGPGRYWVSGEFTVRGRTHPLRVLVRTQPSGKALLMQSDFKLERSAYGLGGGSWADTGVVAADIAVHVQLLAQP